MEAHHHEHVHELKQLNTVFVISIVLNSLFVLIEAGVGLLENSLGLLSDAGHNLGDVFSLLLALSAFKLSKVRAKGRFTYGYKKSTVLISLLNAIILLVAVGAIIIESVYKLRSPEPVNGTAVTWTAAVGIVVNGFTAWLLHKGQKDDLNVRGAFLHMAADTLVSVGVVVSGVIITCTGFVLIDPIVGLLIAVVILVSTCKLLFQSLRLSLDAAPDNIDLEKVKRDIASVHGVDSVHHVHVWAISTSENALTAHIILNEDSDARQVKHEIRHKLEHDRITHVTIETELSGCDCEDRECC